ncbi:MAG: N-acetylmuramoyl-L-alanine amidase [Candidatus Hydrogenedentes bacterium]|nr:N-acetylmuramoyl-L-alanine amidase [Candidatus Hydrogenedentota bacterium]
MSRFSSKTSLRPFLAVLALALAAAAAAEQRIDVVRNGVTATLVLPEYKSQGVSYASFNDIARQIGAAFAVTGGSAVMDLDGARIEAPLESNALQAAGADLALRHPVRAYGSDALIAIEDLVPVLRAAFGFAPPETAASGSALAIEPMETPLESVALPPPAEATPDLEMAPLESVSPPPAAPLPAAPFQDTRNFLLAVDPGHGGEDTGAAGPGGLLEKDLCLNVAGQVRRLLKERYGVATVATRDADEARGAGQRAASIESSGAQLVLSIHCGASMAPGARGPALVAHRPAAQLSTAPKPGLRAAQALAASLRAIDGQDAPAVHEMPLLLHQASEVPGVLIELGNLSNPEDEARLASEAYQRQLAEAIAEGIHQLVGGGAPAEASP